MTKHIQTHAYNVLHTIPQYNILFYNTLDTRTIYYKYAPSETHTIHLC